ncbi:hypothetical protein DFH27DRAFT_479298 [Peziza echinospora]|nr:hypothetical protein DFH27DRAFT_479298 [Peziza echinospora]
MGSPLLVDAHGLITAASGNIGGKGTGLGVDPKINHQTSSSQADTTVFGNGAQGCGRTQQQGTLNVPALVNALTALPIVTPGGTLTMTLHQINGDGAGPYSCTLDTSGAGTAFNANQKLEVVTQVPGNNGISNAAKTDFPLVVKMPAAMACAGTAGAGKVAGVCVVKCQSARGFGGCKYSVTLMSGFLGM